MLLLGFKKQKNKHKVLPRVKKVNDTLIQTALENIDEANPDWTYAAARIYVGNLYKEAAANRGYDESEKYGSFYHLIKMLTDEGIYTASFLEKYSKEEIDQIGSLIVPDRDMLFNYLGIYTVATRYLATDHQKRVFELPQERWLVIAMHLMQDEPKNKRIEYIQEAYWALSNLYMTVATPTLTNAGKTHGQLSSCFIDTVDDSLQAIYDSNTDIAKLSKNGEESAFTWGKSVQEAVLLKDLKGCPAVLCHGLNN